MLLAKREEKLKEMMKRFEKFLERKDLILSSEKSKVLVFENEEEERRRKNGDGEKKR